MYGENMSRCRYCGKAFICGDCITWVCDDCERIERSEAYCETIKAFEDRIRQIVQGAERKAKIEAGVAPLNALAERINANNEAKGWNEDFDPKDLRAVEEKLLLMHTEISEAVEVLRDGKAPNEIWHSTPTAVTMDGGIIAMENSKPEGLAVEIIDLMIRGLHLLHRLGIDIDSVMAMKMGYNEGRPYRHGGKKA